MNEKINEKVKIRPIVMSVTVILFIIMLGYIMRSYYVYSVR